MKQKKQKVLKLKKYKIAKNRCPVCQRNLDTTTPADGQPNRPPRVNDVSVCFYCGCICKFDENLNRVKLTNEEIEALPDELKLQVFAAQRMAMATNRGFRALPGYA